MAHGIACQKIVGSYVGTPSDICSSSNAGNLYRGQLPLFSKAQAMARESHCGYVVPSMNKESCNFFTKQKFKTQRVPVRLVDGMKTQNARRLNIEAARREPISQAQRNAELEEEAKKIDLAPHKLLERGEPGTMQGIIKDVIPVGYFITLPNGKDGYLPALDLGFTGGIIILERLFKVGQELTVRVVRRGGGGREILSMKKPEFAPNTDPKFIFSERGGFGKSSSTSKVGQ
ncbi:hypothetical protein GOP47_0026973 [Adiantum capillus-veneris]|nr:hypothetical protein GOP47_0026973 [Adiantum capillus-veneris]